VSNYRQNSHSSTYKSSTLCNTWALNFSQYNTVAWKMLYIKLSWFWFVSGTGVEGVVKVKRREVEFG